MAISLILQTDEDGNVEEAEDKCDEKGNEENNDGDNESDTSNFPRL